MRVTSNEYPVTSRKRTHGCSGHAVLMSVLITTLVLVILLIPLQIMMTKTVRNTVNGASSRQVSYASEASVHDLVARVYRSSFNWTGPSSSSSNIGNVTLDWGVTQNSPTNVTIDVEGETREVARSFRASTQQMYDAALYPVDIVISIDASSSMEVTDPDCGTGVECSRLYAAKESAKVLVDNILAESINSRITVHVFANYAEPVTGASFSNDAGDINSTMIDNVEPLGRPGTNVGDAIFQAQQALDARDIKEGREGVIVLLTDGSANYHGVGTSAVPCVGQPTQHNECTVYANDDSASSRADIAKGVSKYEIYAIGLSLNELEPISHEMVARDTLYNVSTSNEHYFDSPTIENLEAVYTSIANNIIQKIRFVITEVESN